MKIKTIITPHGTKYEYYIENGKYMCKYSEFHASTGWKSLSKPYEISKEEYDEI